jgi:hypothetical protein
MCLFSSSASPQHEQKKRAEKANKLSSRLQFNISKKPYGKQSVKSTAVNL